MQAGIRTNRQDRHRQTDYQPDSQTAIQTQIVYIYIYIYNFIYNFIYCRPIYLFIFAHQVTVLYINIDRILY